MPPRGPPQASDRWTDRSNVVKPDLAQRLERGEYTVDSRGVAEAMFSRWFADGRVHSSAMLVSRQVDGGPGAVDKLESRAVEDLA